MPKISDLDEYLHADAITNGDIISITGKARFISADESAFERAYLEIPVKLPDGKSKIWTPNKTTLRILAKEFGDDTDVWVGKRVKITISKQNVRGKMTDVIYGEAVVEPIQKQTQANLQ